MRSIVFTSEAVSSYDVVLISTDHDSVDYDALVTNAKLVIDTRNATKSVVDNRDKIVKA
jgi:UDP-N-acetyl-D-glucosamine dehydrogenase